MTRENLHDLAEKGPAPTWKTRVNLSPLNCKLSIRFRHKWQND